MKNQKLANEIRAKFTAIVQEAVSTAIATSGENVDVETVAGKLYLFDKDNDFYIEVGATVKDPDKFDLDAVRDEFEQKERDKAERKAEAERKKQAKADKASKSKKSKDAEAEAE